MILHSSFTFCEKLYVAVTVSVVLLTVTSIGSIPSECRPKAKRQSRNGMVVSIAHTDVCSDVVKPYPTCGSVAYIAPLCAFVGLGLVLQRHGNNS